MPKKATKAKGEETATNEPKVGATLNLAAYKTAKPTGGEETAPPTSSEPERELGPSCHWDDLGDVNGLLLVDLWEGVNEKFGAYMGSRVDIPAVGKNPAIKGVYVPTGATTTAGKSLQGFFRHGLQFDDQGTMVPVAVSVRLRPSPRYPNGRARVLLSIG